MSAEEQRQEVDHRQEAVPRQEADLQQEADHRQEAVQQEVPPREAAQLTEMHLQQLRRTSRIRMERLLP